MPNYPQSFGIGIYIAVFALISLTALTVSAVAPKAELEDPVR